ncbi:cytidine deaminase [Paraliomyxa miuraensis]|uniref:cytidine deaminase n=1 Tax=Paraliomyxa miuraensis TaxID=376150 RepID=UPI00225000E4|nr:cytidine deaminase [Paraliomyxa miuraensis]MCX4245848.1 cytidine deaminase [Paraliomyxa miuraensis]
MSDAPSEPAFDPALDPVWATLVEDAWKAREGAVCRYSGFAVGAVLQDEHGRRFTGANVENASYNLGLCAERVALYHAITHGAGRIVHVAITTEAVEPTSPCGACRQALWEFAPEAVVLLVNRTGCRQATVRALLPEGFDHSALEATARTQGHEHDTNDRPPR